MKNASDIERPSTISNRAGRRRRSFVVVTVPSAFVTVSVEAASIAWPIHDGNAATETRSESMRYAPTRLNQLL
jgi:hypothetical protein